MTTINKLSLVSCLSSLVIIASIASCSTDEKKISFSDDNIITGSVDDITDTSAKISGSYNFYGAVGSIFGNGFSYIPLPAKLDTAELALLAKNYKYPQEVVFPKGCPDSLEMMMTVVDLDMRSAGFVYSENSDFYGCVKVQVGKFKTDVFVDYPITGLKPGTKYWYKTYCQANPTFYLENLLYNIAFYAHFDDEDEIFDYYGYGDTKSFTTLSK